ncbi:MAG: twin-arginine translocase subunit TatC [Candidatus Hydrogenedentes bacterium]|nr:twin-arginine translocase subunit TatC [Candidatus Hydrogenedentota bacterium]
MARDDARMTFTEHLAELRLRIIRSGIALVIGCVVCYAFSDQIFELIAYPLQPVGGLLPAATSNPEAAPPDSAAIQWSAMNFLEPVMVKLRLTLYAGALLALPFIVYQICAFIFPGLTPGERKIAKFLLFGSSTLAVFGVLVAYFGVFPLVLPYLMQWMPEGVIMQLRMNENISLILMLLLGFAVAFQFPLVVLALVYVDLLSPETLRKYRKIAIVGIAVLSMVLTPPDPLSWVIMMAPLVILYELSIWSSYAVVRKRKTPVTATS